MDMYILPPFMDEVLSEEIVKTINEMGGNIPGGNFPGGVWWVGIFITFVKQKRMLVNFFFKLKKSQICRCYQKQSFCKSATEKKET